MFGSETNEGHRPSLQKKKVNNSLPFYASAQHVKNSQMMLQCDECGMWRIIYSKYKMNKDKRLELTAILDQFSYSCGSRLADLQLPDAYKYVEVKDHICVDPIEKLYYAAKFDPICVYCGKEEPYTSEDQYPQCRDCKDKEPVLKKK